MDSADRRFPAVRPLPRAAACGLALLVLAAGGFPAPASAALPPPPVLLPGMFGRPVWGPSPEAAGFPIGPPVREWRDPTHRPAVREP